MTKLVGILNFTPDSFSDGGKYNSVKSALGQIDSLIKDGADVIDIGAESTRPNATPLNAEEEIARLIPLFAQLKPVQFPVQFSIDTRHPQTAKAALDIGFHWVNDVNGFKEKSMQDTVGGYHCTCVVMHSLSVPADKNITLPENCDVIAELTQFASSLRKRGSLNNKNLIFDPGIGFGKTAAQSWQIIERIGELKALGIPLLVGHSRKSFLLYPERAKSEPKDREQSVERSLDYARDDNTITVSRQLIAAGVDYLRVHNVAAHRELL